jgi:triacylglycerol esterase/lipase EstA (alpha/beta hydrolase family)
LCYNAFRTDIHQIAGHLVDQALRSMDACGAGSVHLVGHSLGGLVIRDALQQRGLAGLARTAVTIATPHAGAALARCVPGPAARQMRPGSTFLDQLASSRVDHSTRWIAISGGDDRIVPAAPRGA